MNNDGKPMAALVGPRLFASIRQPQSRFDALSQRLAQGFEGVALEDGVAEIDAAMTLERQAK